MASQGDKEKQEKQAAAEQSIKAEFIHDVAAYMKGTTLEVVVPQLESKLMKLKQVEQTLMQKKAKLHGKLPEISKALQIVDKLLDVKGSEEATVLDYELCQGIFAKAKVENVASVNLWLGAGVMVEYPLEEAKDLLEQNLKNCRANLAVCNEDLDFIKDQRTITEVSIARVFNFDVEAKRREKENISNVD